MTNPEDWLIEAERVGANHNEVLVEPTEPASLGGDQSDATTED